MSEGILESCTSTAIRPRPRIALPARGRFLFPEPYNTVGVRLTNEDDGPILPCGYSYWSNLNAHAGQPELLVFLGVDRNRGGAGPSLWSVDKATLAVTPLGPLFPAEHPLSWATGEGWHWSATDPDILYVTDLTHLYQLHVASRELEVVLDIGPIPVRTDEILWQMHTSADGRVHSATVKAGESRNWRPLGALVYPWSAHCWFPAVGDYDECQVDKSGEWLVIKENLDGEDGEDNRIINLKTGAERVLMDRQGAAGHSDCGYGYMVASDNWNALPNAIRVWDFGGGEPQGRVCYHSSVWDVELNHIAHGNARPGAPEEQFAVGSGATRAIGPRANEIAGFYLDGSLEVCVIAPTMVDLDAPGGGDDYSKMPKGNLDPTGEFFLWTSNHGSDRLDAFIVRVPDLR